MFPKSLSHCVQPEAPKRPEEYLPPVWDRFVSLRLFLSIGGGRTFLPPAEDAPRVEVSLVTPHPSQDLSHSSLPRHCICRLGANGLVQEASGASGPSV